MQCYFFHVLKLKNAYTAACRQAALPMWDKHSSFLLCSHGFTFDLIDTHYLTILQFTHPLKTNLRSLKGRGYFFSTIAKCYCTEGPDSKKETILAYKRPCKKKKQKDIFLFWQSQKRRLGHLIGCSIILLRREAASAFYTIWPRMHI